MTNIDVYFSPNCSHISRLLTGFHMLEQSGFFRIHFIIDSFERLPDVAVVEADINGNRIAFDLGDRWALADEKGRQYLKSVNAYFARGYTTETDIVNPPVDSDDFKKVYPFGFDYYASFPGNPVDKRTLSARQRFVRFVKEFAGYNRCMYPDYFEGKADRKDKDFKILFYTRLWDPASIPALSNPNEDSVAYRNYMVNEWQGINESRIQIIRVLSKEYGRFFSGGIQRSALAESMCPDLILPTSAVRKKSYLDKMKSSDICIGSMGLHKSTGWKTGEYIAAARAIVAEKLKYDVPGNFDDGMHYIPFSTADQCVEAVGRLYRNPDLIYQMKKANEDYYQKYLKPDVQILNALQIVSAQSGS